MNNIDQEYAIKTTKDGRIYHCNILTNATSFNPPPFPKTAGNFADRVITGNSHDLKKLFMLLESQTICMLMSSGDYLIYFTDLQVSVERICSLFPFKLLDREEG